jgi:hypothetical protein
MDSCPGIAWHDDTLPSIPHFITPLHCMLMRPSHHEVQHSSVTVFTHLSLYSTAVLQARRPSQYGVGHITLPSLFSLTASTHVSLHGTAAAAAGVC